MIALCQRDEEPSNVDLEPEPDWDTITPEQADRYLNTPPRRRR